MSTADEYSSGGAEIVVAYFARQLGEFRPPKLWTESVGSRPDRLSVTMAELLERSAAEEDKGRPGITQILCDKSNI